MLEHGIAPATGVGYEIANSLRLNDDDSAYLSRTPASAGNRRTWTWSGWVKRGNLVNGSFFQVKGSGDFLVYKFNGDDILLQLGAGAVNPQFTTGAKFRDTSAWYHIFVAVDTTQATEADRTKLWINGVQYTLSNGGSSLPQNYDTLVNSTNEHSLGRFTYINNENLDGHMAEVHFIDGQALDPSYFGETGDYGEWKPIKYTGTYGTNGFYLDFENSGSLGADVSGNGNNWTPTNLAATDQMLDTPTNNFCVWNVLDQVPSGFLFSEGNLKLVRSTASGAFEATMSFPSSGKYYFEVNWIGVGTNTLIGASYNNGGFLTQYRKDGGIYDNNNLLGTYSTYTAGDIIGVAIDCDTDGVEFFKNGVSVHSFTSSVPNADTIPFTYMTTGASQVANFGQDSSFAGNKTAQGNTDDNGYGDFYYSPPTGYLALCTQNLPDPTVIPSEHFNTILWDGDSTSPRSLTGVGFQPDFVWTSGRNATSNHPILDAVRGADKQLWSNRTSVENDSTQIPYGEFESFDTDGFTVKSGSINSDTINTSGRNYVAWNWKANGTGVSNTDGTITSTVSANVDAGFSIVSYTGNGNSNVPIGHGLNSAPEIYILKCRDTSTHWNVYTTVIDGSLDFGNLHNTNAFSNSSLTAPTSTTIRTSGVFNVSGQDNISYCFHSVDGYSKVGSYTGNGSSDGTFVYTGFRPAYVMIKNTSQAGNWMLFDAQRNTYNVTTQLIFANLSNAEETASGGGQLDFLSNGFKPRNSSSDNNANGTNIIFIAFAEHPFKHTNAR